MSERTYKAFNEESEVAVPDFPRGQVTQEIDRLFEEATQIHGALDVVEQRLRMGGVLRSVPGDPDEIRGDKELREIKVPQAERLEEANKELFRATRRLRELADIIEV